MNKKQEFIENFKSEVNLVIEKISTEEKIDTLLEQLKSLIDDFVKNIQRQKFINKILPAVLACQEKHKIKASVTLAQAILESGWGRASIGNNIFGIKASKKWTGKVKTVVTHEYINGKKVTMSDNFRDYDSIEDSIYDHAKLLLLPRYKPVLEAPDWLRACQALQKCGYSTSPVYAKSLGSLIQQYELFRYDTN